ncbi:MAG: ATP synthase F1 subunit delta [Balneolaceae bacterium]
MITGSKASRRYASAFLQSAIEQDHLDKVLEDVDLIGNTFVSSPDLKRFVRNPVIQSSIKRKVLKEIFEPIVEPLSWLFIQLLIQKGRENLLPEIVKSFVGLYNLHAGIQVVYLDSAYPVSKDQEKELIAVLEKLTSNRIDLKKQVQPGLLGGMAVRIDDTVIDGTVKNKLSRLRTLFYEAEM